MAGLRKKFSAGTSNGGIRPEGYESQIPKEIESTKPCKKERKRREDNDVKDMDETQFRSPPKTTLSHHL
jgi:hypothetical protein